jgi:hypothetical protein
MQVVVPSVSLAAALQGTAFTLFVEIPSSANLSNPVSPAGSKGPPTSGAEPATGTDGGAAAAGDEPRPVVPSGACWAKAADEPSASQRETAIILAIFCRMETPALSFARKWIDPQ